jgi:hypothetical protein
VHPRRKMGTEHLLPPPEEQDRLVAGWVRLTTLAGHERLLSWPLILPDSQFFPDAVAGTIGGLRRLLRRLLAYAELQDLNVAIDVYDSKHPYDVVGEDGVLHRHQHVGHRGHEVSRHLRVRRPCPPEQGHHRPLERRPVGLLRFANLSAEREVPAAEEDRPVPAAEARAEEGRVRGVGGGDHGVTITLAHCSRRALVPSRPDPDTSGQRRARPASRRGAAHSSSDCSPTSLPARRRPSPLCPWPSPPCTVSRPPTKTWKERRGTGRRPPVAGPSVTLASTPLPRVAELVEVRWEPSLDQVPERFLGHEEVEVVHGGLEAGEHHRCAAEDDDVVTEVFGEHGRGSVEQ